MEVLEQTYIINAPIEKVYEALTSAEMAEKWGAAPAKVNAVEGGEFSYWDGDIHGVYTKLVPNNLIEQDWYGHDHPERKFRAVFTFSTNENGATLVQLTHTGERDDIQRDIDDWREYYFEPIKKLLEI